MKLSALIKNRSALSVLIVIILLILLVLLPYYASTDYTAIFLSSVFLYLILTVGWVMFSGPTGYISLAPASFVGLGIYISAIYGFALPFPVVVAISGLAAVILAFVIGALTLRLKATYFAVFTFGLVMLIYNVVMFVEMHLTGTRGRMVAPQDFLTVYYYMLGILALLLLVKFIIGRSKYGLALRCIGQNEEAAAHIGINVTLLKVITFGISSFFMSAAGAVMATRWTYIDPGIAFNPFFSFMPVLMAFFGGLGIIYGPIIGSIVFTYLEEFLLTRLPELFMLVFGIILVVTVLYLPDGLAGLIQKLLKRKFRGNHANT